ncbi:MAG TPA: cysteine dioxygenase family protein [Vicinamibacterales bacterium]
MIEPAFSSVKPRLDAAVTAETPAAIAHQVKEALQDALRCNGLQLPDRYHVARPDAYARRLLHRDEQGRYTVVVMTWGPGQGTPLHDHAGIWCVECVVDGLMEVVQYNLVEQQAGAYRFEAKSRVTAERGSAGCLIPPFEYHTLSNARRDASSITLHVYGGEMDHCHIFEPAADGAYRRVTRALSYHD